MEIKKRKRKLSAVHILSIGYLFTILVGTLLLLLPFSTISGESSSFIDCFFVATSATCVTGLTPFNTGLHWTLFGQIVILCLIQIGGIGFMTIISLLFMIFKKNLGLFNQTIMMQSAGTYSISGVIPLIKKIVIGTFGFETLGAVLLSVFFYKDYGSKAIYYGIFHSISAFCNAGFDCLGTLDGSLTSYSSNYGVILTISALIVIGGLGFIVWSDIIESKFRFKRMQMHSKIVLVSTLVLILVPAVLFFFFEFTNIGHDGAYTDLSVSDKILNALFLSVSPRTAGFNSLDLSKLTPSGKILTICLMFIGGNPGSTAGGVKVTTIVVILFNLIASAGGKDKIKLFKQTVPDGIIKQSSALFNSYIVLIILATIIISFIEPFSLEEILFEVVSAVGTVGLTLGITSSLSVISKLVIIILMFAGRMGAFALFDIVILNRGTNNLKLPEGRILVG